MFLRRRGSQHTGLFLTLNLGVTQHVSPERDSLCSGVTGDVETLPMESVLVTPVHVLIGFSIAEGRESFQL